MGQTREVETTYFDRPCKEAENQLSSLQGGKYAEFGSGANSVHKFCLISMFLGLLFYFILSRRREGILSEVYSKLTIVKNKNNN